MSVRALTGGALFLGAAFLGYRLPDLTPPSGPARTEPTVTLQVAAGPRLRLRLAAPWHLTAGPHTWRGRKPVRVLLVAVPTGLAVGFGAAPPRPVPPPLTIQAPSVDSLRLWGPVRVTRTPQGLLATEELPLEAYLEGVLLAEMGPRFPLEALRAQAVAARSFAWALRRRGPLPRTEAAQVFRAAAVVPPPVRCAVRTTRAEILGTTEAPLRAYYHSTCGGATRDAAPDFDPASPLKGRPCNHCRDSPFYRWRRSYGAAELLQACAAAGLRLSPPLEAVAWEEPDRSQRYRWVRLRTRQGSHRLRATRFRRGLARVVPSARRLPSTRILRWRWDRAAQRLEIHGAGWGHGVGLCQYGARGLAQAGLSYRQILAYYYGRVPLARLR